MGINSHLRGHKIEFINNEWVYSDTKKPTAGNPRDCGNCNKPDTKEGHDPCLGTLIGLRNACCGHGETDEAYVQFIDGKCVRGKDALNIVEILKKVSK